MKKSRIALGLLAAIVLAGVAGWFSLDKETRGLLATVPTNRDLLFWSEPQRDAAFRALDRLPVLDRSRVVPAGGQASALPPGPPLHLPVDVDAYMAGQRSAALLIVHDGKVSWNATGSGSTRAAGGRVFPWRNPSRRRSWARRFATASSAAWTTR